MLHPQKRRNSHLHKGSCLKTGTSVEGAQQRIGDHTWLGDGRIWAATLERVVLEISLKAGRTGVVE